ncbi:DUF2396 family protein [Nodularia spumigena]
MNPGLQYPIFGSDIQCPHCRQTIPALTEKRDASP